MRDTSRRNGTLATAASRFGVIGRLGCPVSAVTGRGADREVAICRAVVELLNETSYESVTMDAVAARAKASKATIYRRWSNKDDLVVDALSRVLGVVSQQPLPDTGNLRDDMVAAIQRQTVDPDLLAANTAALKGLIYAASSDPALAEVIRGRLRDAHLQAWQTLLQRAHLRGELGRPVDAGLAWEVVQGQFCARTGVESGSVDTRYVQHVVEDVLLPVILHAGARAGAPAG